MQNVAIDKAPPVEKHTMESLAIVDEMTENAKVYRLKDLAKDDKTHRPKVKRKPSVDPKRTRKLQKASRNKNR